MIGVLERYPENAGLPSTEASGAQQVMSTTDNGGTVMSDLKAANKELDKAFLERDIFKIRQLTPADHVAVIANHGRPPSRDELITNLAAYDLTAFEVSDMVVTTLNRDVGLVDYNVRQSGTYDGMPLPARVFVSESWLERDGEWT